MNPRRPVPATLAWEKLYVEPAPETPPCAGAWYITDITPAREAGSNLFYTRNGIRELAPSLVPQVTAAFEMCGGCDATMRAWCEGAVRPRESAYSGVCGGRVWSAGRPVWDEDDHRRLVGRREAAA
jgi:hypothetical protein